MEPILDHLTQHRIQWSIAAGLMVVFWLAMFARPAQRIPLWLKLAYATFVAVLLPFYWTSYGPINFLYFCDVALLVTLVALWLESSLLASMQAIAIVLPQLLWQVDFIVFPLTGKHFPIDLTGYMFDSNLSLFLRSLSFFHFWLPILLLWLVWRLGYDRRALVAQALFGAAVLIASYLLTPVPFDKSLGNVNKSHGWFEDAPQTWMHPWLWLSIIIVGTTVVFAMTTHFLLRWLMPERRATAQAAGATI